MADLRRGSNSLYSDSDQIKGTVNCKSALHGGSLEITLTVPLRVSKIKKQVRGQGTGDRGQGIGNRGQGTEDRVQGTEDRGQGTGDRGQGTEDRGQTEKKLYF